MNLKYRVRLHLVRVATFLGRVIGLSYRQLGRALGREVMLVQAADFKQSRSVVVPASSKLDVVFMTMIAGHVYIPVMEIVLGLGLRARGHRVRFVVCDKALAACEVKKVGNVKQWARACDKCWYYGSRLLQSFGFEKVLLGQASQASEMNTRRDGWREIVEASLLKHFGVGMLEDSEAVRDSRRRYEQAASMTERAAKVIAGDHPDRVLMSHGIYSTWGPAREVMNELGVPVVTYGKGKKAKTMKFNWSTSADWWDVSAEWANTKSVPLSREQENRLDSYLESRRTHESDTLRYNFGDEESARETYRRLALDSQRPVFIAFTNVLWDAASAQREIVFSNPIEWIIETIRWFEQRPELQLVVKVHPAEVVIGTNQPFEHIIRQHIGPLPDNVRLIGPAEQVNSWSIIQVADLGIVHTSTIGLEMPLVGVPCMVVSRTHFRDRGFTIDVSSRKEYYDTLSAWQAGSVDTESIRELARRYAYLLFERYQLPFEFMDEVAHTDVRSLLPSDLEALVQHPMMSFLVDCVEQERQFVLPADPSRIEGFWTPVR